MSTATFFPYYTSGKNLDLIATVENSSYTIGDDRVISAHGIAGNVLDLSVECRIPNALNEYVLPSEELDNPPLRLDLVSESVESRIRKSQPLVMRRESVGRLSFARDDWTGTVLIRAVVTRSADNPNLADSWARRAGSLVAWSEPIRIEFNEPANPTGRFIDVKWERFAESQSQWRRSHSGHLFALDSSGPTPRIFLNSGIYGARTILDSRGTTGPNARIRDSINFTIVHQIWTSLMAGAFAEVNQMTASDDSNDDLDLSTAMESLSDLNRGLIEDWARFIFPDFDPASRELEVLKAARTPQGLEDMMARIPNAVQERFQTYRGLPGLIEEFHTLDGTREN